MNRGYINWKLVLVLVLGLLAVGVTVVGVRKFNRTQRAEQGLKKGLEAYEQKHWKQATAGLGQYLSVHQSDIEILIKYGDAHSRIQPLRRENYAAAVNAYRAAVRLAPNNREAVLALTDMYLQGQTPGEAELTASRYLENQLDSEIARRLATAQMQQRKFEPAAELLLGLAEREPYEPRHFELLARLSIDRADLTQKSPQQWLDSAVANNPQSAQAYLIRGNYHLYNGQRTEAMEDIEKASQYADKDVDVRLAIAAAFLRLQASDAARQQLDVVFVQSPASPELWQFRAMLAAQLNDPALALQTAQEGLSRLADDDLAFLPYAVELYLLAEDTAAARETLSRLRKTDFNPGMAYYLEGLLAERDGNWPQAMTHWREAILQGYTAESVHLKLAEGAVRMEDRASAIETLRRYINRSPQSFVANLAMARVLAESRQWKQASEYAAAAGRLDPSNPDARQLQSRCRIELAAAQPQSLSRVDQMLTDLLAAEDTLENRLVAFRIMVGRQDWPKAEAMMAELKSKFGEVVIVRTAEAELWLRQGQPQRAKTVLDEAVQQFPGACEPVILRSVLMADQKEIDAALALLAESETRMTGSDQRKVRLWAADLSHRNGRSKEAIEMLSKMADENPQDIAVRRQLLAIGRETADAKQLQQWVDQIQTIEGQSGRLWKMEQVSIWLLDADFSRRYAEATALLNDNLKLNPDDKQSLMLMAAAHERAGNIQLSVSLYREAMTRHPEDIDLAIATMGAMYRANEFRQADRLLSELLAAGYGDPRLAQLELQGHLRQGRLDSAESMLEKIVAADAKDSGAKMSLAMLKSRNGQFEQARQLIDELIAKDPASPSPQAALADWYLRQGLSDDATKACNDYVAAYKGIDAYRLRAQVLLAVGEKELAVADIERVLAMAENNADTLLSVSQLYRTADLLDKSLDAAKQALTAAPNAFDIQKNAALLYLERPQTQVEGLRLLEQALTQQPRDAQLRLRKGQLLLENGSAEAAMEGLSLLNTLAAEYPRLEAVWDIMGQWYLFSNQQGMAMDCALRGLSSLPDSRSLLLLKAKVEAMRSPAIALETLTPLVRRYPDDAAIVEMQARLMHQVGSDAQAIESLRRWSAIAQGQSMDTAAIEMTLMELLYTSGQTDQAFEVYQSLQNRPQQAQAAMLKWMGLIVKTADADQIVAVFEQGYSVHPQEGGIAALSAAQGLMNESSPQALAAAERILQRVYSRQPDSVEAVFGLALLRHAQGQKREAIPLYEKVLELNSSNVLAINNLAWILSQEKGEHARAMELAEKGLAMAPDYTDLIDTYATVLYELGHFDKAAEQFKRAADRYQDSQPQKTASTFRLAQCLEKTGKKEVALVEFFKARDLDQKNGGLSQPQKKELAERLK